MFELLEQVENLDFHSDIMADIKIYKNSDEQIQVSGLANIDNITVLDPNKKHPKSFIYLTFWGNKTGVLSNIYATSDKKIYAEGVINNSKKPEIDLKVKTDKIKLTDVYNKIKLFVDCSKYKGVNLADGYLQDDFTLKGDLNKIRSNGYMKITNASINSTGIKLNKINPPEETVSSANDLQFILALEVAGELHRSCPCGNGDSINNKAFFVQELERSAVARRAELQRMPVKEYYRNLVRRYSWGRFVDATFLRVWIII